MAQLFGQLYLIYKHIYAHDRRTLLYFYVSTYFLDMFSRYVRTIQNPAPTPASTLPRKNKVKKASQEKRQVCVYKTLYNLE